MMTEKIETRGNIRHNMQKPKQIQIPKNHISKSSNSKS